MPYSIEYWDEEGGVIVTYTGIVTDEDIYSSLTERLSCQERVERYKYAITDCTYISQYDVTTNGMINAASKASNTEGVNKDIVAICIMPNNLEFGMARLWEGHVSQNDWNVRVVRNWDEANTFLEEHSS